MGIRSGGFSILSIECIGGRWSAGGVSNDGRCEGLWNLSGNESTVKNLFGIVVFCKLNYHTLLACLLH